MKKYLFGAIIVMVALSSCFSHEQKKPGNRWWVPEKKDVISWEKLDTIVVGDGLFKLEYPDCFELSEESDDSSVLVTYKEISGLFLTANAEKNPYHWNADTLADLKKRGGMHNYREFYIEESDNGYHFMVYDSCHHNRQEIVFGADDYLNGGVP